MSHTPSSRTLAPLLVAALLTSLALPLGAVEHDMENEDPGIQVDPHVTDGESVVVSRVTINTTGWLVIHADDGGSPGEVVGNSTSLDVGEWIGVRVQVTLDAEMNETVPLHAMLHHDDGDGEYGFPDGDPPLLDADGSVVNVPFTVRVGTALAVVATGDTELNVGQVPIEQVHVADPGYVVLHHDDGGPGQVVGNSELLEAGAYTDVMVGIDQTLLPEGAETVTLWAMLHDDDGDGEYGFPDGDPPVAVNGTPVMTAFTVRMGDVGEEAPPGDGTTSPSPSPEDEDGEATPAVGFVLLAATLVAIVVASRRR